MLNSRDLDDLDVLVKEKAIELIRLVKVELDLKLIITSTLRDFEYQNYLYEIGRSKKGKIVTNAKAGYSYHNFGLAFDVVPSKNNELLYDTSKKENMLIWQKIGKLGTNLDLEWAGNWTKFKEYAHFQYTYDMTLEELREEYNL